MGAKGRREAHLWEMRSPPSAHNNRILIRHASGQFRNRDERTGKWVKARYVASLEEIQSRHAPGEWEVIGRPELRTVDDDAQYTFAAKC